MSELETVTVDYVGKDEDIRFGDYDKVVFVEDLCIPSDTLFSEDPEKLIFLSRGLEDDRTFMYIPLNGHISKGDVLEIKKRPVWV